MWKLFVIFLLVGCTSMHNLGNEDTDIDDPNPPVNQSDEIIEVKKYNLIIGKYVEEADEYPTTITLYEDKTMDLVWNFCGGMDKANGTYDIVENVLIIDSYNSMWDPFHAEFEILSDTSFKYIPYTFKTNVPNESFSCRFVDIYTLEQ